MSPSRAGRVANRSTPRRGPALIAAMSATSASWCSVTKVGGATARPTSRAAAGRSQAWSTISCPSTEIGSPVHGATKNQVANRRGAIGGGIQCAHSTSESRSTVSATSSAASRTAALPRSCHLVLAGIGGVDATAREHPHAGERADLAALQHEDLESGHAVPGDDDGRGRNCGWELVGRDHRAMLTIGGRLPPPRPPSSWHRGPHEHADHSRFDRPTSRQLRARDARPCPIRAAVHLRHRGESPGRLDRRRHR